MNYFNKVKQLLLLLVFVTGAAHAADGKTELLWLGQSAVRISTPGGKVILVVIFDERSSLGLVRLRVKRCSEELNRVFQQIMDKTERDRASGESFFQSPFAEITDEDIDALFNE